MTAPLTVIISDRPDPTVLADWDRLVASSPTSDVAQLSMWAEVRRKAKFDPLYILVQDGRQLLVGGALVLRRRFPILGDVGYVPYGPVLAPGIDRRLVTDMVISSLRQESIRRLRMLFVQPPLDGEDVGGSFLGRGFRLSDSRTALSSSLRLDLTKDEEELRAGLKKSLQQWTRRWEPRGVKVRRGGAGDVAIFTRLHHATASHQGFRPASSDYISTLVEKLAPAGHAELFLGEVNGEPVAARLYTVCGGMMRLRLVGMDRNSDAGRLSVAAATEWGAIRWAKTQGLLWFDFGGIADWEVEIIEAQGTHSEGLKSITASKVWFGGEPYHYPPPLELISPTALRAVYDGVRRFDVGRRLVIRTYSALRWQKPPRPVTA